MSSEFNEKNYSNKMDKSIQSLKKDISTLRTGRANVNMLDTIKIDVYGQLMPIEQLGTISVPEARLISIQVWDKSNVSIIESAIQKSELGINPQIDGQIIRLRIPDLTEERRKDLIKILKNMGEKSRVSIRNIRREANEELKKKQKDKSISEDQSKNYEKIIQKLTDTNIENIELISQTASRIAVSVNLKYEEKVFKKDGELINETTFEPFLKVKYILGFSNKSWKLVDYISGV